MTEPRDPPPYPLFDTGALASMALGRGEIVLLPPAGFLNDTEFLFALSLDLHSLITMTTPVKEAALRSMPYQEAGVCGAARAHCLIVGKQNSFDLLFMLQPWSVEESKSFPLQFQARHISLSSIFLHDSYQSD